MQYDATTAIITNFIALYMLEDDEIHKTSLAVKGLNFMEVLEYRSTQPQKAKLN